MTDHGLRPEYGDPAHLAVAVGGLPADGLAMAYDIFTRAIGALAVRSTPGDGTKCTILPSDVTVRA
ncbi:hypothetical protein [Paractinoplanes brasiliensis]|uniref:Uncharacterized protein n=1 Tax=Paractinoplanes brasiliensis TaxID=52695 RepID=A0A4R6JL83_9ACTN|nr:hypothetical protein [Actinoplanes brasiliensis]TDO36879.1 hypothetical protein C8E87_0466 [Actinoplanes brasiliensis]GID30399.1 hypothetical protein Abr02nite_53820 [Actinoplanes brasiliensis]